MRKLEDLELLKVFILSRQDGFWARFFMNMFAIDEFEIRTYLNRNPMHKADMAAMKRGEECPQHGGRCCFHVSFKYKRKRRGLDLKDMPRSR
jgi:hypothetical protein